MKYLKSLFTTALLFCISIVVQAQEIKSEPFFENDIVVFTANKVDCVIPEQGVYAEYVLFKLRNKTSSRIEVSFYVDTYRNGTCTNCDHESRDRKRILILEANQSLEGNCNAGYNNGLKAFSKWLRLPNESYLTKLEVSDVHIKNLEK